MFSDKSKRILLTEDASLVNYTGEDDVSVLLCVGNKSVVCKCLFKGKWLLFAFRFDNKNKRLINAQKVFYEIGLGDKFKLNWADYECNKISDKALVRIAEEAVSILEYSDDDKYKSNFNY